MEHYVLFSIVGNVVVWFSCLFVDECFGLWGVIWALFYRSSVPLCSFHEEK
jgi:hypothetical protein